MHVLLIFYVYMEYRSPARLFSVAPLEQFLGRKLMLSEVSLLATSFDSRSVLLEKYAEIQPILSALGKPSLQPHVRVMHDINAWQTSQQLAGTFDQISWNHPHLGVEDFRLHRFLMAHFFDSVRRSLTSSGRVTVSLVHGQAERWDIVKQAAAKGFKLVLRV